MNVNEFFEIPRQCFEKVIGFKESDLIRELKNENPAPSARYWNSSVEFAKKLDMSILQEDVLHDVMFSVQLGLALLNLENHNKLPRKKLRSLRNDKVNFDSLAFEPQVLSYLINTGHQDAEFSKRDGLPDLFLPEQDLWIECKKLQSLGEGNAYLEAFKRNYEKASEQIEKVGQGIIVIEIDNRNIDLLDRIKQMLRKIRGEGKNSDHVLAVIITYWDRKPLYEVPNPDPTRDGLIYQVRRHAITIKKMIEINIPNFTGETFEFFDVPPVRQVRYSVVARSDDWLKLTRATLSGEKYLGDGWLTWDPAERTK